MELDEPGSQLIFRRDEHRFFDELVTLLAGMTAVRASLELQRTGRCEPYAREQRVSLLGMERGLELKLGFRPADVLGPIANDAWPEELEVAIGLPTPGAGDPFTSAGLRGVVGSMLQAAFVRYFETMRPEIHARFGPDYRTWHATLNFARIVRNACAHGGTLNFNKPTSLGGSWRGITFNAPDHGHQILFNEVGPVELIVLMGEMETVFQAVLGR